MEAKNHSEGPEGETFGSFLTKSAFVFEFMSTLPKQGRWLRLTIHMKTSQNDKARGNGMG